MILLALLAAASFDAGAIAQNSATLNALGPHPFGSPRNQAAAQFVAAKLQEAGLGQTVVEEFTFDGAPATNVVASLPGRSDRLLIIATHHDSRKDDQDVSDRSRSLSLLIEIGRQASRLRPAKTWILGSFDGGESKGEGLAHYLEALGKSRSLVDGVIIIEAASLGASGGEPALIAPACANGVGSDHRGIASRDLVAAAVSGVAPSLDFSFDDPGINLLTQPFIRAFKTPCDPLAERALGAQLGVLMVGDTSYSRRFLVPASPAPAADAALRDNGAVRLGDVAFSIIQAVDGSNPTSAQSDSWLVVGKTAWPGWAVFLLGLATLLPGLIAARVSALRLALRGAPSALFAVVLYFEPEIALFAGALPNLAPASTPRKLLALSLTPFGLLVSAGGLGFIRGQVIGTWLPLWMWLTLVAALTLLFVPHGSRKKPAAKSKRKKS